MLFFIFLLLFFSLSLFYFVFIKKNIFYNKTKKSLHNSIFLRNNKKQQKTKKNINNKKTLQETKKNREKNELLCNLFKIKRLFFKKKLLLKKIFSFFLEKGDKGRDNTCYLFFKKKKEQRSF